MGHLKQPALSAGHRHLFDYPTPPLLDGLWGFGSLGGIGLQVQIVTGIVLAMHYTPHVVCAGVSIEHILREVYGGWMLRHAHANGASLFFIAVFLHLFRGLAMGHAWRVFVWCLGVLLLLLSVVTAFVGYVLPWGQMSFWGATVITSLASALPVVGLSLVSWLWGGLSVENATLNRFLSLHYLLPFIIAGNSVVHIAALHQYGSNHPLVGANPVDKSAFLTDSIIKDLVGWVLGAIGFSLYAFFTPIALGHPDNSIHANPLTTPAHIVPEWYFLALYAILRSIPNKQSGVAAVALVIFTLVHLGWGSTSSKNRCVTVQPLGLWVSGVYAIADALHLFWILGADVLILGWSGSHCTPHAIRIGQLWGAYSFLCFAILPTKLTAFVAFAAPTLCELQDIDFDERVLVVCFPAIARCFPNPMEMVASVPTQISHLWLAVRERCLGGRKPSGAALFDPRNDVLASTHSLAQERKLTQEDVVLAVFGVVLDSTHSLAERV